MFLTEIKANCKRFLGGQPKEMCYSAATPPKKQRADLCWNTKPTLDNHLSLTKETVVTTHSSATAHEETPHETETTTITISDATKRRAESVINDRTIHPQWRTIIRFALELNDPFVDKLVSRAEAGEDILETFESLRTLVPIDEPILRKVEALAEIVSRSGDEPTAALFLLMETLENSTDPKVLASRAKHVAFSRCGELHVYEMIDAQLAELESELLATNTLAS